MKYVRYHDQRRPESDPLNNDPAWGVAVPANQHGAGHGPGMWHVLWSDGTKEGYYHETFLKFLGPIPAPETAALGSEPS